MPPEPIPLPPYREACLAIGDFVPLLRRARRAAEPAGRAERRRRPGRDGRQLPQRPAEVPRRRPVGVVQLRGPVPDELAPPDPDGEPRRPRRPGHGVIRTYPGERLRIRLIQGSHEEQHGFVLFGIGDPHDAANLTGPALQPRAHRRPERRSSGRSNARRRRRSRLASLDQALAVPHEVLRHHAAHRRVAVELVHGHAGSSASSPTRARWSSRSRGRTRERPHDRRHSLSMPTNASSSRTRRGAGALPPW